MGVYLVPISALRSRNFLLQAPTPTSAESQAQGFGVQSCFNEHMCSLIDSKIATVVKSNLILGI